MNFGQPFRLPTALVAVVSLSMTFASSSVATLRVSPSGSDSAPCTTAQPCKSFDRAYRVAAAGETIQVAGTFGSQTIRPDPGKSSTSKVIFEPAPGASGTINGSLEIEASDIEIADIDVSQWSARRGAANLTFRRVDTTRQSNIASADSVSVIGGDIGPVADADGIQVKPQSSGDPTPRNILIDGVRFHDITRSSGSDAHADCIQVGGAIDITIRNSTFERCHNRDILFGTFNGGVMSGALIENNWLAPTSGSSIAVQAEEAVGMTFRYNSIGSQGVAIGTNPKGGARNNRLIANVGNLDPGTNGGGRCSAAATFEYNVWENADCSGTDVRAASGFQNESGLDYRLRPGAAAIGRGKPGEFPTTDIFGAPRGLTGEADAGAHEFSSPPGAQGAPGGSPPPEAGGGSGGSAPGGSSTPGGASGAGATPRCLGQVATIVGTAGDDRIVGTKKRDVIVAFGGNDVVRGRAGADIICLGNGNDKAFGGPGADRIRGGKGKDRIQGGLGKDMIWGAQQRDLIWGGSGQDSVRGGPGADYLNGGPNKDRLWGGLGPDRLVGGPGADLVWGGRGRDRLLGGPGRDTLRQGSPPR